MPNETPGPGPEMIRVLVRVDVPEAADALAIFDIAQRWNQSTGFVVDRGYRPVRIRLSTGSAAPKRPGVDQRDPRPEDRARREYENRPQPAGLRTVVLRGRVPPERAQELEGMDFVRKVSADVRLDAFARGRIGFDCEKAGEPIGDVKRLIRQLGVDRIWADGYDGRGVVVAVVDGGIAAHGRDVSPTELAAIPQAPAFGRVVDGWPFDWGTTAHGWGQHGNMVAFDIQTVAPGATLYDIRIWEPPGVFDVFLSNAVSGYREAIDSYRFRGQPQILTNSWGLYDRNTNPDYAELNQTSDFVLMVEEALDEGMLVLFAAGNCGSACPTEKCRSSVGPGKSILGANGHPRVITVGAANLDDDWCAYTSQGPSALFQARKPDFCAYTRFEGYFPGADPILRDFDGGTSAATAVAAGVVALLKHKRPDLTQSEVMAVLAETAEECWVPGVNQDAGAGIIRAKAAFDLL